MSKKVEKQEPFIAELLLVCAEINPTEETVKFGCRTNQETLIKMCKEDNNSWEIVKKIITDTINKIEELSVKE